MIGTCRYFDEERCFGMITVRGIQIFVHTEDLWEVLSPPAGATRSV